MTKECQNCKVSFEITDDDLRFYNRIKVPPPTWCPECRFRRRILFRNEINFYRRKCDLCKKDIISIYKKEVSFPVYCHECWYSDKWDIFSYGMAYDFEVNFIEQLNSLFKTIPRLALTQIKSLNSEYTNFSAENKNCYLCVIALGNENCTYSSTIFYSRDCFDCLDISRCELCYQCLRCDRCSRSSFCSFSENLIDCIFCYDCRGLINCFGCVGLRNKSYCWLNEQLTKDDYKKRLEKYFSDLSFRAEEEGKFITLLLSFPHRYAYIIKSSDSIGDYIVNSKRCLNCFKVQEMIDSKNIVRASEMKDSMEVSFDDRSELSYEIMSGEQDYKFSFGNTCWYSSEIQYCSFCFDSQSLFACIGLRNKSYCILNKQYTKEEYEKLVPRIIEHMNQMPYIDQKGRVYKYGEFFPPELSPFSYNETIAQEYFPLTKEEALDKGYSWKDPEPRNYKIQIPNDQLPDHIKDVQDDIVGQVIECAHAVGPDEGRAAGSPSETSGQTAGAVCNEQCTEAFKIIQQELAFLRKMNLPLPRLCPNCRHYQRIKQRNPLKLWHRKCQCQGAKSENQVYANTADHIYHKKDESCQNEFETTYAPERPEIVYCEQCYLREVV